MDIDSIQDAEIERMRHALKRMEADEQTKICKRQFFSEKEVTCCANNKEDAQHRSNPAYSKES